MRKKLIFKCLLTFCLLTFVSYVSFGQGTTTSSIAGQVLDENGLGLYQASVLITHEATGSRFGNTTAESGNFRISNLDVGGPYKIEISYIGYQSFIQNNIFITLGQEFKLKTQLFPDSESLNEIVITANKGNLKTGAETNINKETINLVPTVSRSLNDLTRLTPQANFTNDGGLSIAGMNNRFNAILLTVL